MVPLSVSSLVISERVVLRSQSERTTVKRLWVGQAITRRQVGVGSCESFAASCGETIGTLTCDVEAVDGAV